MNLASNLNEIPVDPEFKEMVIGASKALRSVLDLSEGDNLLIVLDDSRLDIGQAFLEGARKIGVDKADFYSLSKHKRPITALPPDLKGMFRDYNVIVNTFNTEAQETPFRVKLLYEEIAFNAKVGHAPGITREMMFKGPMNVDYATIVKDADRLMDMFTNADEVHMLTEQGTDLTLGIRERGFSTDVKIPCGSFGNLPAGEVWCAPEEDKANGVVVIDGSIGDIEGFVENLHLTIKDGKLIKTESEDKELAREIEKLVAVDEMASVIGELGIGLNPNARLTGNLLEDEKAGGTAHIAFGNNIDMINGQNNSQTHRDFLFMKPTMVVTYLDGSTRTILRDGKVVH